MEKSQLARITGSIGDDIQIGKQLAYDACKCAAVKAHEVRGGNLLPYPDSRLST